jgi:predicted RNA-binding Zn ribbon-like protein
MASPIEPMRQPGGRVAAPGRLHVVQDFINTRNIEADRDELSSPEMLGRWLRQRGLLRAGEHLQDAADMERARRFREALRELCAANHDRRTPDPATRETVEAVARHAALTIAYDADLGWHLRPESTALDGALGVLVAIMYDAEARDEWSRLKACGNDRCGWAFWDGSPNRTGRWCAMAICGNRAKVSTYRARRR